MYLFFPLSGLIGGADLHFQEFNKARDFMDLIAQGQGRDSFNNVETNRWLIIVKVGLVVAFTLGRKLAEC